MQQSKFTATGRDNGPVMNLLTRVSPTALLLQLQLQRVCEGLALLLQQLQLGGVDLSEAEALGLHLQPALSLDQHKAE